MNQIICPVDGKPCARSCPDRYHDRPEGGCFLTTFQEVGGSVLILNRKIKKGGEE